MSKVLKVAWICHFSNKAVREKLDLRSASQCYDYAPWITNLISGFQARKDVHLCVISPCFSLRKVSQSFELDGVSYHFFRPFEGVWSKRSRYRILQLLRVVINKALPLNSWFCFPINSIRVLSIILKCQPDIVNLHGAENHFYSASALWVKRLTKIPILVTIQGIYSNPIRFNKQIKELKLKSKIERLIHQRLLYFGIFPDFFADLIRRDNKNPIFLLQSYPLDFQTIYHASDEKIYDFTFFGRVSDVKGVDKIIAAIAHIKHLGRKVTLIIIGYPQSPEYLKYLQELVAINDLEKQVSFLGHFKTIAEVHRHALEARVTVISSKFDVIPGTIIESVLMDQPVCATSVGAIPFLNRDGETILLSKYGDIEGLAKNMLKLLDDPDLARDLTSRCKQFILREFDPNKVGNRLIRQYSAVMEHFYKGTPIPADLLHPSMKRL